MRRRIWSVSCFTNHQSVDRIICEIKSYQLKRTEHRTVIYKVSSLIIGTNIEGQCLIAYTIEMIIPYLLLTSTDIIKGLA